MPSHPVRSALLAILVALVVVALPQVAPGAPLGTSGALVLEPLTETADADETDPAWSPDGSTLLVTRRDEDGSALVAIDLERGAAAEVVRDAEAGDWSPDGRSIVFVRGGELWVVAASGGEAVRISEPDAEATFTDPAWSPDGSLIAATVTPDGSGPAGQEVGVLPAAGGAVRLLTSSSDDDDATTWVSAHEPAWHPDGRSLIYTRRLGDGTALHRVALSDGADAALLPPPVDDDPSTEAAAAPSPDVGWLAFWGDGSVWLVDPAAPALRRRLTLPEENLDEPAFSPD
ncbi:MAG: hypothetical protein AVDCRST_MAG79-2667, partial [uncultured Thermoleophilia bacterium]